MSSRSARRRSSLLLLALLVSFALWAPAPKADAQRPAISRSGELGGAPYLTDVPPDWNQRGLGPGDAVPPPLGYHIRERGHAWIASGYRAREYRPDVAIDDLLALRELFLKEIGRPKWSIIYGPSMGSASPTI